MFPFIFNMIIITVNEITIPLDKLTLWFGTTVLNISDFKEIEMTRSGDATFDYVTLLVQLIVSFVIASLISIIKIKQKF